MTKFSLCKARNVFRQLFNEPAKKVGGVRWGVAYEMNEQVDRIGLDRIRDEYVMHCYAREWSIKSSRKFLNAAEDIHDRCVAVCEIAGRVDVGDILIPESYLNETDSPAVFTVHEGIVDLKLKFAMGVDGFERSGGFNRLETRATESAQIMEDEYMVRLFIIYESNCQTMFPHY